MKKIITLAVCCVWTLTCQAQQSPEKMIDRFFKEYVDLGPQDALDNIYSTMPWVERVRDDVDQLKMQFGGLQNIVGNYYGHELIANKDLADSFSIFTYLVRFDRQPIRFTFQFYRPDKDWGLYGFSYDDNLDDELEEAVRLHYMNAKN